LAKAQGCVWLDARVWKAGPSNLVSTRSTCASLVGSQDAAGFIHPFVPNGYKAIKLADGAERDYPCWSIFMAAIIVFGNLWGYCSRSRNWSTPGLVSACGWES